jgi:hypothetical protein
MGTLVHATSRVAIGFVPYVGPALDLCECITGKAWCLPSGQELSDEERIFSGLGFAVASVGPAWRGVKNAGISPAATRIAEEIAQFGEELATMLRANRRTFYKTLRGAVTSQPINDFERKAARYLMKDEGRAMIGLGDDGVRTVLGIPKDGADGIAQAADFVTVTKGNKLALGEAKGGLTSITLRGMNGKGGALDQLKNTMNKLKELGLAGDVERVELIINKGAKFSDENCAVKNGFLVKVNEGYKAVELEGFKNLFVRAIEL